MDLSNLSITQEEQKQVNTKEEKHGHDVVEEPLGLRQSKCTNTSHLRTRTYTLTNVAKQWA